LNSKVEYKGRNYSWDTVMQLKTRELTRYVTGRTEELGFTKPSPKSESDDCRELRERILNLNVSEARTIGIGKTTLWYLRDRARTRKPLRFYKKVKNRICVSSMDSWV